MPKTVDRLYEQFQPKHYDLMVDVDKEELTFTGTVVVRGNKIGRPSKRLTFHQKGLKVSAASIFKQEKGKAESIPISRINLQNSMDEVRLHTENLLYPGEYTISIEFSGEITKPMHGIYPCFFKHEGVEKRLIATQFESHHAREAFPCIDEPEAKATFDLKLSTPLNQVVLGNTPVKKQFKENNRLITFFETSPVMSTYLLAFVFGELKNVSAETKNGVLVSSYATAAQDPSHLEYANSEAVKILEFFEDYFKTPFPLQKLDQVALPDFEALAMENWGLITFREVGLLSDPKNRSLSGEQLITLVIAHEISHQWFGNLVTMKWWDDLWLNESFASIMENIAPDRLHPDWEQWEDFVTGRVLSCSHRDIYKDVQPVGVVVKHPDEIGTLFDPAIVYAKGARLLNMLYEYIGEDAFRTGLQNYFKKHAYKNTSRHDLWKDIGAASGRDIDKFMTPWIQQSGQPLVKVKRNGENKLELTQKRFLMDGEDDTLWPIPLLADQKLSEDVMNKRSLTLTYTGKEPPIFNVNGNGHFIAEYTDDTDRKNLSEKIVSRSIGAISRITLLNDMLLLARKGEYTLDGLLDIIAESYEEPRDAVWSIFMRIVGQAQVLTDGDKTTEKNIKSYKNNLSQYWYKKLGWKDQPKDDPNTKHLRSTALALSIAGENPDALKTALSMFETAGSVEKLPAEQRAMIATAVVRHGDSKHIQSLMKEYEASPNPDVQSSITSALCSTKKQDVAKRIIEWGLKEGGVVRQQDIDHWYAYLMRNHYTRELAWEWFVSSWNYLTDLFGGGKHMEYYIWYSSGPVSTPEWQRKFIDFFKPKESEPSLKRNIQIAFSEIEARVEWRQREEKKLIEYFKKQS